MVVKLCVLDGAFRATRLYLHRMPGATSERLKGSLGKGCPNMCARAPTVNVKCGALGEAGTHPLVLVFRRARLWSDIFGLRWPLRSTCSSRAWRSLRYCGAQDRVVENGWDWIILVFGSVRCIAGRVGCTCAQPLFCAGRMLGTTLMVVVERGLGLCFEQKQHGRNTFWVTKSDDGFVKVRS